MGCDSLLTIDRRCLQTHHVSDSLFAWSREPLTEIPRPELLGKRHDGEVVWASSASFTVCAQRYRGMCFDVGAQQLS
jgi:hypothetical protein